MIVVSTILSFILGWAVKEATFWCWKKVSDTVARPSERDFEEAVRYTSINRHDSKKAIKDWKATLIKKHKSTIGDANSSKEQKASAHEQL